jgi:hypothetical protein
LANIESTIANLHIHNPANLIDPKKARSDWAFFRGLRGASAVAVPLLDYVNGSIKF